MQYVEVMFRELPLAAYLLITLCTLDIVQRLLRAWIASNHRCSLGTGTKRRYWKTAVKGVIYNQEKTYLGLENQRRYWGEAVNGGAVLGEGSKGL